MNANEKDKDNLDKNNLLKAYKYRLYPTKTQEELMDKYFTASREFYNIALEDRTIKFYSALTGEAILTYKEIDEKCKKLLVDKICSKEDNKKEIAQEFFELSNEDQITDEEAIREQIKGGTLYECGTLYKNLYKKLGNEDQRKIIGLVLRILYKPDNNLSQSAENCVPKVVANLEKLISIKTIEQEFYVYYKNLNPECQGPNADYETVLSDLDKKKIARELIELFLKKRKRENPKERNNVKEEIKKKHREIKNRDINIKINEYIKKLIEEQIENKTLYTDLDKNDQNKIRRLWLKLLYEPYLKFNKVLSSDLRSEILEKSEKNLEKFIEEIYGRLNEEHKAALIRELIKNKAEKIIHSEFGTSLKKKQEKEAINNLLGEINNKLLNESAYITVNEVIRNYKKDKGNRGELYLDKVDKAMLDSVYDDLNTVFANFCEGKFSKKIDPKKGRSSKGTAEYPHRRVENLNSFTYSDEDEVKQCKVIFEENRLYHPLFPKANHSSADDSKGGIRCIVHRPYDKSKKFVLEKCTISQKLSGKYYVVIVIDHGEVTKRPREISSIKEEEVIGIDIGEKELGLSTRKLCIYPEGKIKNPIEADQNYSDKKTKKTYNNKAEKRYQRLERKKACCRNKFEKLEKKSSEGKVLSSNEKEKARKKLAILNERITNKKRDYWHHQSINLLLKDPKQRFDKRNEKDQIEWPLNDIEINKDGVLVGRVNLGNPSKDWRKHQLGKFKEFLEYKARWYGVHYLEVNESGTTNICSACKTKYTANEVEGIEIKEWTCANCEKKHREGDTIIKCPNPDCKEERKNSRDLLQDEILKCVNCGKEHEREAIKKTAMGEEKCPYCKHRGKMKKIKWKCGRCKTENDISETVVKCLDCNKEYPYDRYEDMLQRKWTCKKCKKEHDRDENAAKNIARITLEEMKKEPSKTKESADKLMKGKGGYRGKGGGNSEHHKKNKNSHPAQKKYGVNQKYKNKPNNH
ncbi:hypothetical protein COTS27_00001 [Spirochaetota bacterium]|nr:hypothetical protein COTS27_00001 [Spirochaetota bacterium]